MEIGYGAFSATDLGGTLVIPAKVTTIGYHAFKGTKLTGVDLSSEISSSTNGKLKSSGKLKS